jgi:hypothetical protein
MVETKMTETELARAQLRYAALEYGETFDDCSSEEKEALASRLEAAALTYAEAKTKGVS